MWSTRVGNGLALFLAFALWLVPTVARAGVSFGQLDDFQTDTAGWQQGNAAPINPNPPTVISTGGPSGPSDPYLQNVSSGGFGPGGKQVMFNRLQWTGNFVSAGVTRVTAELQNFGTTPLAWPARPPRTRCPGTACGADVPSVGRFRLMRARPARPRK